MDKLRVTVVYASQACQCIREVVVAPYATVVMAVRASQVLSRFPELAIEELKVGIFGRKVALDAPLKDGDQVEIYRELRLDPMMARRQRAKHRDRES